MDEWDRMIDVNIKGVLYGIAAALPHMQRQRSGHIINVSSVAGHKVRRAGAVYSATKHAVRALSEGLRQEVKPYNIRTTIISPGVVVSELPNTASDPDVAANIRRMYDDIGIPADSFARAVAFAIEQPDEVDVNEILFRPTRQEILRGSDGDHPQRRQPSGKGPADWFTGTVRIDPLFQAPDPARVAGASVTFEPGARTAWHTHPLGQTLIVTAGLGRAQRRAARSRRSGRRRGLVRARREALARCLADHRHDAHRHPGSVDGKAVKWLEHVSDDTTAATGLEEGTMHTRRLGTSTLEVESRTPRRRSRSRVLGDSESSERMVDRLTPSARAPRRCSRCRRSASTTRPAASSARRDTSHARSASASRPPSWA